ncbi:23S rRNA (adenine(2503)-C(2))-methyltransferase RlmN [bacterium]|nr:23S rRNA (adenine(2503)-C(2))-methyltransferase RlmN [bacterium]
MPDLCYDCVVIYFQSLTRDELADLLLPFSARPRDRHVDADGTPLVELNDAPSLPEIKRARMRAKQIYHWVYQRFVTDWDQMTDLNKEVRGWLKENVEIFRLSERHAQQATDGTHKFLWNLPDHKTIESVIIPAALQEKDKMENDGKVFRGRPSEEELDSQHWSRLTACISSQVGCAMACKFCLTGIQGLDRSLAVHEIVTQVFELRKQAPITNIVFMGMGEPLHNVDNVIKACKILLDEDGMNFSKRKVTVSTSGLVPAIEQLGQSVDVSLAISLNATTDEVRSKIMPVNKKWNIEKLMETCRNYPLGSHRRITFEYVLLKDVNDTMEDAARLLKLVRGIPNKINLIPFNEHSGSEFLRPSDETVRKFQRYLVDRGLTATVRISRGQDILAACGQLRSIFGTARGSDRHKDWAGLKGMAGTS